MRRRKERGRRAGERKGERKAEREKSGGKMGKMEERMRNLELEGEKKRREERKRNVRRVELGKEGYEGLREKVERIMKKTGAVALIEGIRRIGGEGKGREECYG